jgi:hypothetical protein
VKQGSWLYHYKPPYTKGEKLTKTLNTLESMATAPSGDLFFGGLGGIGPHGQFAINRLTAPYTGTPEVIFNAFGPPGQMAVWK